MKKLIAITLLIIFFLIFLACNVYSQDYFINKIGDTVNCKILYKDKKVIKYEFTVNNQIFNSVLQLEQVIGIKYYDKEFIDLSPDALDYFITENNDTIKCNITNILKDKLYYRFFIDENEVESYISINKVKKLRYSNGQIIDLNKVTSDYFINTIGDTIHCTITKINKRNLFFDFVINSKIFSNEVPLKEIKAVKYKNEPSINFSPILNQKKNIWKYSKELKIKGGFSLRNAALMLSYCPKIKNYGGRIDFYGNYLGLYIDYKNNLKKIESMKDVLNLDDDYIGKLSFITMGIDVAFVKYLSLYVGGSLILYKPIEEISRESFWGLQSGLMINIDSVVLIVGFDDITRTKFIKYSLVYFGIGYAF